MLYLVTTEILLFLLDPGLDFSDTEIFQGIVDQTSDRLEKLGYNADLRVGRNSSILFDENNFDYILACHCCYYCDEKDTFADNLQEYARVMKSGAIASRRLPVDHPTYSTMPLS